MYMGRVSTYLNFPRNTEEVFNYYKSIFGGEFSWGGVARFKRHTFNGWYATYCRRG